MAWPRVSGEGGVGIWSGGGGGGSGIGEEEEERALVLTRESEAAELVLEQLEQRWFCDNVVRWQSSAPASPPSVIEKSLAVSPFRSPETTRTTTTRPWSGERPGFNHPRSRMELRRLSDGDHLVRRLWEKDQIPRRPLVEGEVGNPRFVESLRAGSASVPQSPSLVDSPDGFGHQRGSNGASQEDDMSPFAPPSTGRLMGVTEDEEMENDLFSKMIANRPAKLTTIRPGRSPRGPLQESNGTEPTRQAASKQVRQRRRLKGTKSLTDLEYEELRGLKDLGFEVSKDDLTPHIVRMFPGLQRQGIPPYNSNSPQQLRGHPSVQHVMWQQRPDSPLLNSSFLDPSVDMKGHLKSWASAMASIVSTEC